MSFLTRSGHLLRAVLTGSCPFSQPFRVPTALPVSALPLQHIRLWRQVNLCRLVQSRRDTPPRRALRVPHALHRARRVRLHLPLARDRLLAPDDRARRPQQPRDVGHRGRQLLAAVPGPAPARAPDAGGRADRQPRRGPRRAAARRAEEVGRAVRGAGQQVGGPARGGGLRGV